MITAEQFAEWKEHPVTKEVFAEIRTVKKTIEQRMHDGLTIDPMSAEITHGLTSKAVGQLEGLNQLLNISYADESEDSDVSIVSGY
jgi:hypothetical protein